MYVIKTVFLLGDSCYENILSVLVAFVHFGCEINFCAELYVEENCMSSFDKLMSVLRDVSFQL